MLQGSRAKSSAASAAKSLAPKQASNLPSKGVVGAPKKAAATSAKAGKAAVPGTVAKKSQSSSKAAGAAEAAATVVDAEAAGAPVPSDRQGRARVVYNHYSAFFPVDSAGKMRWQAIDDEYCLSFGEIGRMQRSALECQQLSHAFAQCLASNACQNSRLQRCFQTVTPLPDGRFYILPQRCRALPHAAYARKLELGVNAGCSWDQCTLCRRTHVFTTYFHLVRIPLTCKPMLPLRRNTWSPPPAALR
jgi:hypothetical protein